MALWLWLSVFVVSLFILVKSSDLFTGYAEKIGLHFRIPPFIVGVTIVSIGTSLPELASSIFAVLNGSSEIVAGNVLGSNIANILFVLGLSAVFGKNIKATYELMRVDLPAVAASTVLVFITFMDGVFTFGEGIILLLGYFVYVHYTFKTQERRKSDIELDITKRLGWKCPVLLVLSGAMICFSAQYTVSSVVEIASMLSAFGITTDKIAATAVALGTSLPELSVTITAARKGQNEIALGNVLGSNIFNPLVVLSVSSFIGTLVISNTVMSFVLPVFIAVTLLYIFVSQDKEVTHWEGAFMVLIYVLFIMKIFMG